MQSTTRLGTKTREAGNEHVKRKAARDIVTAIKNWTGSETFTAKRRWTFELIQNAIDTARARGQDHLKIEFVLANGGLKFRHNAGHFTLEELSSLIYGGSSKPYSPESIYIGRFGTGFLVSHIISRTVIVSGIAREEESNYQFSLKINRESKNEDDITNSINDCFEQLDNLSNSLTVDGDSWTTYEFSSLDALGHEAISVGMNELRQNLPFIFAFNKIDSITIDNHTYSRSLEKNDTITKIAVDDTSVYYKESQKPSEIQVAILEDSHGIIDLTKRPTIFIGMPVTESADYISLPFAMNSLKFETNQERDSLTDSQENKQLISKAFELYYDLVTQILAAQNTSLPARLFRLVKLNAIPDQKTLQNHLFEEFNSLLTSTFHRIISEVPLVNSKSGRETISKVVFPDPSFNGTDLPSNDFEKFIMMLQLTGKNIPDAPELDDWIVTAKHLKSLFEQEISLFSLPSLKEELETFVKSRGHLPSFSDFALRYSLQDKLHLFSTLYQLLDSLYNAKIIPAEYIDNLVPSQSEIVGQLKRLWHDTKKEFAISLEDSNDPIPDSLKNIASQIGLNVKDQLVHLDFSKYAIIRDYVRDSLSVDALLIRLVAGHAPDPKIRNVADARIAGWIGLFQWCVSNKRLIDNFPIVTKSLEIVTLNDLNKETLIVPFECMGVGNAFESMYPENRMIHFNYFDQNESERKQFLEFLSQYKAIVTTLPLYQKTVKLSGEKVSSILSKRHDISKFEHEMTISDDKWISYLPLWSELIGRVSEYKERAQLVFRFAMENLASRDKSWTDSVHATCNCKDGAHMIHPSVWLANLKTDSWVPIKVTDNGIEKTVRMQANMKNIEELFASDEFDRMIAADGDLAMKLLSHFNFDALDLKIKLHSLKTGIGEGFVRSDVSSLVALAGIVDENDVKQIVENQTTFREIMEDVREKAASEQQKQENRTVGENIEKIIRRLVEDAGLRVNPIFVGGDMEIWPDNQAGSDNGEIELSPYVVEVKSTAGSRVHLSKAQSKMAINRNEKFVILVIEDTGMLKEQLKATLDETALASELVSEVVKRSKILEDIHLKLGNLPDSDEIEADLHGYWIKSKLWDGKLNVNDWLRIKFTIK